MYAVVETGGKQVRLETGDSVKVERLSGEVGDSVELDDVRLIVDGENVVAEKAALDASMVKAVIRGHGRGDKVYAFRFKRRKNIRTKRGHRQYYTELEVTEILTGSD
ncbi:MAG: 50S ribosomal protein L21 [Nitrospinota bacterium]|jgi:large subunit ribosomal protein L21|nr:50S ribosomal protein L21 [Nitrospinota bacterium]MDP7369928.1 50S ribosomal protein L21 [Nitrospinota bacterium]MDP7503094.1 50S ribosomal protein L21 [Nitrospinota bacterium]MDP7664604.1 50S ribosomal protein L21 [Nitrospinota bacterium]HJP14264.1 50S ribosomal protein L21 [Nitrospinota bacterium]|tara:strand:- start:511 stop:831 length:321 start_codon:yes stop_codon:yes gene_type:complete